jgi:membrane protease YdiL (CAAX protease family)
MQKFNQFYDILLAFLVLGLIFFIEIPYLPLLLSAGIILIYTGIKGHWQDLGLVIPENMGQTIMTSILMAIILVLTSYFLFIPTLEFLTGVPHNLGIFSQLKGNTQLLFTSIALGWIIGGFTEELIFRGFFISKITNLIPGKMGAVIAVLITSIIFGYLHKYQGVTGQLFIGIIGTILGGIYLINKKRLVLNIFIHGFVNTISMLMLYWGYI